MDGVRLGRWSQPSTAAGAEPRHDPPSRIVQLRAAHHQDAGPAPPRAELSFGIDLSGAYFPSNELG
jgi:hypothetical protein